MHASVPGHRVQGRPGEAARATDDAGLRPGAKLAAQCAVAGAFVGVVAALSHAGVSPVSTTVTFGFGVFGALWEQLLTGHVTGLSGIKSLALRMSDGFYYALAAFAVVSESNAVNVADGVDGLAASLCATAFVALGVVCLAGGRAELGCFSIAMGGASAGFLVVNRHPASAFMGDSGSLALGGALGAVAAAAGGWALFPLVCVTGVFVAEVLSVIAQVAWFKWTKRRTGEGARLFRMAPLHHHLELGGWGEVKVVATLVAFGRCARYRRRRRRRMTRSGRRALRVLLVRYRRPLYDDVTVMKSCVPRTLHAERRVSLRYERSRRATVFTEPS